MRTRTVIRSLVMLGFGLVLADEAAAQRVVSPRWALGLDFADGGGTNWNDGGFVGPAIGVELGARGPLRLRVDASVLLDPWTRPMAWGITGIPSTFTIDSRMMRGLATGSIALEVGTSERLSSAGLFGAARVGGGIGYWEAGDVFYSRPPAPYLNYRASSRTEAVLTAGAETGVWLMAFGRPYRIALRVDGVHGRDFSSPRTSIVLLRHW